MAAAMAMLGLLLSTTSAWALPHCGDYELDDLEFMDTAAQIQWLTEELAQCDRNGPALATDYNNRGTAYARIGEHSLAIADYDQGIVHDPSNAQIYNNRGLSKFYLNRPEDAVLDFVQAMVVDPIYMWAYNNFAYVACYLVPPETDLALEQILVAFELEPQRAIEWQAILRDAGLYTGPVDGDFDDASQVAFKAWCESRQ